MALRLLLAIVVFGAAVVSVIVAAVIAWGACLTETSEACGRQDLANTQLAFAAVALVPLLALGVSIISGRRKTTFVLAFVAVTALVVWAVLADAAHHGWDDLKFVPFS